MDGSGDISKRLPLQDYDVIRLLLYRFDRAARGQKSWAEEAKQCVEFFEGNQWTPEDRSYLEAQGRPILTINKIRRLLMLIWGYHRQENFEPVVAADNDNIADENIAEVLSHLLKGILDNNHYQWLEEEVFQDGTQTGRGYIDCRLDFAKSIHGDIRLKTLDPGRVYPDPDGDSYDPDTWNHVSISTWMGLQQILLLYGAEAYYAAQRRGPMPYTNLSDITDGDDIVPESYFGLYKWFADDGFQSFGPHIGQNILVTEHYDKLEKKIRVIEQQHKKLKRVKYFAVIATGELIEIPELWDAQRVAEIMTFAQERGVEIQMTSRVEHRIRWTVTAGDVLLFDDWSPYDHFTVIPFFPYFRRGKTRGVVADLIDPQREINKRRSSRLHIINTTAYSGWWYEDNSLEPDEVENLEANGGRPGFIGKYRQGSKKPERIEPGTPATTMEREEDRNNRDLLEVSGISEDALGQTETVQAGIAIQSKVRQTVVALEPILGNLKRTRTLLGERILRIIQRYYTERRIVKTIGLDKKPALVAVNELTAVGDIVNDVTVGRYTVSIKSKTASETMQAREFAELLEMVKAGILPLEIAAPILIEKSSITDKDRVLEAFQNALMQGATPPAANAGASTASPPTGALKEPV
jgi:hypothetical protein